MPKPLRNRDWARSNAGVFALLPWLGTPEWQEQWDEYLRDHLRACADWGQREQDYEVNRDALIVLGRVFDQVAMTGSVGGQLECSFRELLGRIHPTYQTEGEGAGMGWAVAECSCLFRRVGQVTGRLWEAIARGTIGVYLRRCPGCGLVQYRGRPPQKADRGTCSRECIGRLAYRRKAGFIYRDERGGALPPSPRTGSVSRPWASTAISPLPTAPLGPVTESIQSHIAPEGKGKPNPSSLPPSSRRDTP